MIVAPEEHDIFSEENRLSPPCRKRAASPSLSIFATPSTVERDIVGHDVSPTSTTNTDGSGSKPGIPGSTTAGSTAASYSTIGGSSLAAYHRNTALCLRNSGASAKESSTLPLLAHPLPHHHHQRLFLGGSGRRTQPQLPVHHTVAEKSTPDERVEEVEAVPAEAEAESSNDETTQDVAVAPATQRPVPLVSRKPV
uniref:Uncharacterized protein n=1 Tax=Anopheles maculatus TaxID=74869 RepID=A0A182SBY1_9DIPT